MDRETYQKGLIFAIGEPNRVFADHFTGQSYLSLVNGDPLSIMHVTFEPGCRSHWHVHHARENGGQVLICTGGQGWYQQKGERAVPLTPGMSITVDANVEHWHGARADSWCSLLVIGVPGEETGGEWLGEVSEGEYPPAGE